MAEGGREGGRAVEKCAEVGTKGPGRIKIIQLSTKDFNMGVNHHRWAELDCEVIVCRLMYCSGF